MSTIKCQLWLPSGAIETTELDSEFYILPNFRVWEIANNQAEEEVKLVIPSKWSWKLLQMLQITRNHLGRIDVNSFYRTESFNASVGGDTRSCHLISEAVDISRPNQTPKERDAMIAWWSSLCDAFDEVGAIGLYSWGYHLEIGSDRRFGQTAFAVRNYLNK